MARQIPNSASIYSTGCQVLTHLANHAVSLGLVAGVGASASAAFLAGSTLATASPLLSLVVAAGQPYQSPMINVPAGVIVASVVGGSAVVWMVGAS